MIAWQARLAKQTLQSKVATQSPALHPKFTVILHPPSATTTDKKQKSYLKIQVAYGSGSWRIRTADPLLVRQMLWTSWAKLPICKAWDCKGSYYFLISKLFISFFKGSCHLLEARPHLTYLWTTDFFLLPTSGRHHSSLVCHLSVHPSHFSAWTRTWT